MAICILLVLVFSPGFLTFCFSGAMEVTWLFAQNAGWGCGRMARMDRGLDTLAWEGSGTNEMGKMRLTWTQSLQPVCRRGSGKGQRQGQSGGQHGGL